MRVYSHRTGRERLLWRLREVHGASKHAFCSRENCTCGALTAMECKHGQCCGNDVRPDHRATVEVPGVLVHVSRKLHACHCGCTVLVPLVLRERHSAKHKERVKECLTGEHRHTQPDQRESSNRNRNTHRQCESQWDENARGPRHRSPGKDME